MDVQILCELTIFYSSLPAIDDITMAGVIATGTHGSGIDFGIMATLVRIIKL